LGFAACLPSRNHRQHATSRRARTKDGYYHDGRYPNLLALVDHYDNCFNLGLSSGQKADLVES
jgi:hypothetical protein